MLAFHISNSWQFVSLNGYNSNVDPSERSIPIPVLFLNYINLHGAIKYSEVQPPCRWFLTSLNFNNCVKCINRQVIHDLIIFVNWLKANKISVNISKTELVLFASPKKQRSSDLKIKLRGKGCMKHLSIQIDKSLTFRFPH